MLLHEKKPALDAKELRVKIHVEYHLKLHALKLLRGKSMSEAVEEALEHYFQIMRIKEGEIPSVGEIPAEAAETPTGDEPA